MKGTTTLKQSQLKTNNKPVQKTHLPHYVLVLLIMALVFITGSQRAPLQAQKQEQEQQEQAPPEMDFYQRLAKAALERTKHIVVYNPKYFAIPYPNGDVPAHFGVCTDVVIRAYRQVGIDLQKEVHQKMGGDKNITHRRVRELRKFLKRVGAQLPVSQNPQDYKPGDLVTYYIPESFFSKDHIAIVSDKRGVSGNYMIVHNIGLGPKLDDDLMSFKITGHYRYRGRL